MPATVLGALVWVGASFSIVIVIGLLAWVEDIRHRRALGRLPDRGNVMDLRTGRPL